MHHLIGLGSCLCLSLHHSISSVITHMPQRGGRPDNGRLKGPWARQRGAAVCHRGNTASSPNYPSTALGKTQWGRSLATWCPPHPLPKQTHKKVMSWRGRDANWGGSSWMLPVNFAFNWTNTTCTLHFFKGENFPHTSNIPAILSKPKDVTCRGARVLYVERWQSGAGYWGCWRVCSVQLRKKSCFYFPHNLPRTRTP